MSQGIASLADLPPDSDMPWESRLRVHDVRPLNPVVRCHDQTELSEKVGLVGVESFGLARNENHATRDDVRFLGLGKAVVHDPEIRLFVRGRSRRKEEAVAPDAASARGLPE